MESEETLAEDRKGAHHDPGPLDGSNQKQKQVLDNDVSTVISNGEDLGDNCDGEQITNGEVDNVRLTNFEPNKLTSKKGGGKKAKRKKEDPFDMDLEVQEDVEGDHIPGQTPKVVERDECPKQGPVATDAPDELVGMKTAAQKRAEKKERDRLQKLKDKKSLKKKPAASENAKDQKPDIGNKDDPVEEDRVGPVKEDHMPSGVDNEPPSEDLSKLRLDEVGESPELPKEDLDQDKDGEVAAVKKKKKKKKAAVVVEEKPEKKVKKPGKAIKALKEALRQKELEEERLRIEEELLIKEEDDAETLRLAKLQEEDDMREKRKQAKKDKKERQRAEGTYLTATQKKNKRRDEERLEMMKQMGIVVLNKEEVVKKKPVYGKKKKKLNVEGDAEEKVDESTETLAALEEPVLEEKFVQQDEDTDEDGVKDNWDVESSDPDNSVVEDTTDEDDDSEGSSSSSIGKEEDIVEEVPKESPSIRIQKRVVENEANRDANNPRAPVICVLGHVDTGKTKILDKIRKTNVQDGEAGGITQQIGATNIPHDSLVSETRPVVYPTDFQVKIPGLLVIDTPGHESFSNLRSRGSSLCDMAILVVDVMHGLEPQTIESIEILKSKKTPFVVALNKIDRLYGWKPNPKQDVKLTLKQQDDHTRHEFDDHLKVAVGQLNRQGLNAALYYDNPNVREYLSIIPTSAHSGDGMCNLIAQVVHLTQTVLAKKIAFTEELQATVLEVKALVGLGTTIDVILVNGRLKEGDTMIVAGFDGPIVTPIRGLHMPQPLRELRVKNQYVQHREVLAAHGVKISAKDLDKAVAGTSVWIARQPDEVPICRQECQEALHTALKSFKVSDKGVYVQSSTLGSLEALLEFLKGQKIKYSGINIGPVHKKDVMKASVMLQHDVKWAVILAFDVKVEREAEELAAQLGVTVFTADIIYHLESRLIDYLQDLKMKRKDEFRSVAVFPAKVRILPTYIFNSRDPIIVGVVVEEGILKPGTPLCVPSKENLRIGSVSSIEMNNKSKDSAVRGDEVCIKIENTTGDAPKLYGRHFDHEDVLVSLISRTSIDALKDYFRDELSKQDWQLIIELKKQLSIL